MVGIAQPENFNLFIRKIGYSVGLENTLDRFSDFCHLYATATQIKQKDWKELVHDQWKLKTTNIGDVFSSLGIVQVSQQGVFAGSFGEAGGICLNLIDDPKKQQDALRHLLALAIVLADGDIFLNCLGAEFKTDQVPGWLTRMVLGKRQQLFDIFHSQAEREAIAGAITIERQKTNKGGGSKGGLGAIQLGGLSSGRGKLGLPQPIDVYKMDAPSADYLRHVLPARKEWARTLGLAERDGTVTDVGWGWLKAFGNGGFALASGEYSLRPTKFEIERARLSSIPQLVEFSPSTWDYVRIVCGGLGGRFVSGVEANRGYLLGDITKRMFETYREFSQDRRMVRNELPLLVALAAYMAICCATNEEMTDYDSWLRGDEPAAFSIKTRTSRTIELGITAS